jgi:hypothetical protein
MAILDRPMFQRPLTKDQLRGYGLPAFANGGVVRMRNGGDPLGLFTPGGLGQKIIEDKKKKPKVMLSDIFGDTNIQDRIEPETAITGLVDENYKDKILRDLENPAPVLTEQEPSTETTESIESDTTDSARRLEAEEKGGGNKKDDEPKPVDDTEELKKKYLKESKLLKEILGDNKEMVKRQGFLQLAQFGLNLASAQGSNFLDKVAKSAKDPLNAFAELGRKAFEDERAIELMALEQVRSKEAADTEYERELAKEERQATLAKELQQMKVAGAEDDILKLYKRQYGDETGTQKFLELKEAQAGATKTDFIAEVYKDLIATGQYGGEDGVAKATAEAQQAGDALYGPGEDGAVANQGDVKTMSSESDWQNIKVGEQFVLPNGQTGTKTGNALTDYTLG